MNLRAAAQRLALNEDLNFLLTNRVPRIALTRFMGWWSRIRHPWVRDASMAVWKTFSDLDLSEARETHFHSLHDCFIRELKPGLRPIDPRPGVLTSPSDGIVGACGRIEALQYGTDAQLFQAKGFPYRLLDLLGDDERGRALARELAGGSFVTLRLTSSMYHRFHAPCDATLEHVTYISGDTWNVNPIALQRVERLFCRNERAVLRLRRADGGLLVLVPVAAILVASMRLRALDVPLNLLYRGPHQLPCSARYQQGDELGWFEHGSTILVLAPPGLALDPTLRDGHRIHMGEALLQTTPFTPQTHDHG
ncbi:archaetidylserine decarboxylase [Hydrogenophaga sp. ZJX-1]|uniref:archaetidylserine decarboxylase n=1 Tax=Hydrogenophaga sp. ZJX-1 TaxID=3404778 RepID=UPI003B27C0E5